MKFLNYKLEIMETKMNKSEIKELLHHREPYLLLDSISELSHKKIISHKKLNSEDFYFQGHFEGAPILPGSVMQEMTTQTAGVLITKFYSPVKNYNSNTTKGHALGVLKKVSKAKYKGFAKPNDTLSVEVSLEENLTNLFEFKAKILKNNQVIMENEFQLINVSDELLY